MKNGLNKIPLGDLPTSLNLFFFFNLKKKEKKNKRRNYEVLDA